MKVPIIVLGPPDLHGEIELKELPYVGSEVSVEAFNREPVRFFVQAIEPGEIGRVLCLLPNENGITQNDISALCGFEFRILRE